MKAAIEVAKDKRRTAKLLAIGVWLSAIAAGVASVVNG